MNRLLPALALITGCTAQNLSTAETADLLLDVTPCQSNAVLTLINDAESADNLKAIGLLTRAADNLVGQRDADGYANLDEVDAVSQVGPVAMATLMTFGEASCAGNFVDTCPTDSVLALVNDPATDKDALTAIGVFSRGASNVLAIRDGVDGMPGTDDDFAFSSLEDLDNVSYIGASSMDAFTAYGTGSCASEIIMSPQYYSESHLARVQELLDNATGSVDIAMYSMSDYATREAMANAAQRGVSVRVLYDGAGVDNKDPEGSRSAELEDAGIEVRYVNKIMHNKFAIVDGPRDDVTQATTGTLINGSGNWSYSAGTRYDENTVFMKGDEKLVLQYQQQFNHLWANSRTFVWNESIPHVDSVEITDADIDAADGTDAVFTTANFRTYVSATYGPTFARDTDEWTVAQELVDLIWSAESSIKIASGHFRARPIAEAVIAKAAADPHVDIQVYLDGQEYTSAWYYGEEQDDYDDCMAAAIDAGDIADCVEIGQHFGRALFEAGVPLKFKYYSYRWDYTYADQMHHKYLVIDDDTVATGSYNFSANAEFATVENVAIYTAERYPALVSQFVGNFDSMWATGDSEGLYDSLLNDIDNGTDATFPIVFAPMALEYAQVESLKDAISANCPDINSDDFRENPGAHRTCSR